MLVYKLWQKKLFTGCQINMQFVNSYLFLIFAKFVEKRIRTPCNCNFFPPKSLFKCIYLANEKIKSKSVKSLSPLNLMGVVAHHLQLAI